MAFTHEFTATEASANVLSLDDDLALWALFATDGLPLANGGEARAENMLDLPPGSGSDLPAGQGMIGQVLTGPEGWLADYKPGDLLAVRLARGTLDISTASRPPELHTASTERLRAACAEATAEALERYREGKADHPFAPLHEILLVLLSEAPDIFAPPQPPLSRTLRAGGLETFGGSVAVRGGPWNLVRIRHLSRSETVTATKALGLLLGGLSGGSKLSRPGGPAAEALGYLTSTAAVTGYLADEIERRTAEGAEVTEPLAALDAIARTSTERAAVTLLVARVAEGRGGSAAAERLIHEVLAIQPDLEPALLDAGEYAACRGDIRAADGYLRQVDHQVARNLRTALARVLIPPKPTRGRNQPCPCGSGRKYKMCCLGKAVHPIAERAELVYALLASFAERAAGSETLSRLVHRTGGNPYAALPCVDLMLTDCGFTDRFLRARGDWLRDDERKLIESWRDIPIGMLEIRRVQRGAGVTVRTLPDGEPFFLEDRLFSTHANRLDLFCGRLFPDGTRSRLLALPTRIERDQREELRKLLDSQPSAQEIAEFFAPHPDPYLRNADGHDYYDTEVVWEVPDEQQVWARLADRLTHVDVDAMELLDKHEGKTISRGRVTRTRPHWTLWANSRERLTDFEEYVRDSAPGAREVSRKAERVGGPPHRRARGIIVESYLMDADATYADAARMHGESWVDQTIDILGMTPRAAAAAGQPRLRAELEMLLDDLDWRNDREAERGRPALMDVAWIRRELGILATR